MARAMSVQMFNSDDDQSVISTAMSETPSGAYSCPPVPLRRRAKMKKSAAPPPPAAKVTTPLSQSASSLPTDSAVTNSSTSSQPMFLSSSSSCSLVTSGGHHVSDDCAINELLEGRMDLEVFLPDGRQVLMNVERRTPMMDLLVQVTTPNKISPGGHVIHILTDRGKDFVHYKPSTPIGSLDTNSIYIVPKSSIIDPPVKKMPKVANKPFETTFRLQVNLPRGQLTVYRVSPKTTLAEIKQMACRDKNLDHSRYQLVHPQFPNQILDLNSPLSNFGCTEISLMSNSNINANIRNSTSDLIAYAAREDDKKKKGILGLFSRKKSKGSVVDSSSDSMDSRGVSPSRSDSSGNQRAKVSVKKRPAPPPPPLIQQSLPETSSKSPSPPEELAAELPTEAVSTVSHSRHSSDSSGYHEASLLSESPDNLHPDVCSGSASSGLSTDSAVATSSITPIKTTRKISTPVKPTQTKPKQMIKSSVSDTSLLVSAANKKRKAPPPPPSPTKTSEQKHNLSMPELTVLPEEPTFSEEGGCKSATTVDVEELETKSQPSSPTKCSLNSPEIFVGETLKTEEPSSVEANVPVAASSTNSSTLEEVSSSVIQNPDSSDSIILSSITTTNSDQELPHTTFEDMSSDDVVAQVDFDDEHFEEGLPKNPLDQAELVRQPSLTSLGTIADVQNSFDITIAEAEKVLEEERRQSLSEGSSVSLPNSDLPTSHQLHSSPVHSFPQPLLTSDDPDLIVSQQQILSHIEAAFNAVEEQEDEIAATPITAVVEDDLGWEYPIPDPPPAFRNEDLTSEVTPPPSPSIATIPASVIMGEEIERIRSSSHSSVSSEGPPPPLPTIPPPAQKIEDTEDAYDMVDTREYSSLDSPYFAPKPRRGPLLNFTIGAYKKHEEDIFASVSKGATQPVSRPPLLKDFSKEELTTPQSNRSSFSSYETVPEYFEVKSNQTTPETQRWEAKTPEIDVKSKEKLYYGLEGSVRGIRGQVKLRCAEMADNGGAPATLVGRSASVLCLVPPPRMNSNENATRKMVERANSNVENLRKSLSVQDLNGVEGKDGKIDGHLMVEEQERLQDECQKLHQKFLLWNQQLQENQIVLERQKIVPSAVPVTVAKLPPAVPPKTVEKQVVIEDVRCQTLPRQKSRGFEETGKTEENNKKTFTLERQPRTKSQVLANVTIGSWQQRKVVAMEKGTSKMPSQSMENINRVSMNGSNNSSDSNPTPQEKPTINYQIKPRPASMFVGSSTWQKNTSNNNNNTDATDRAAAKPKIDVQINNGNTFSVQMNNVQQSNYQNSLRQSTNKTTFKAPEIRQSSFVRQRLPPEDVTTQVTSQPPSQNGYKLHNQFDSNGGDTVFKKFALGSESSSAVNGNHESKTVTYLNRTTPKENHHNNNSVTTAAGQVDTKTVQINGKTSASNGVGLRPSFSIKPSPNVVGFKAPPPKIGLDTPSIVEPPKSHLKQTNGVSFNVTSATPQQAPQKQIIPNNHSIVPIKNGPPMPPPLPAELTAGLASLKSVANRTTGRKTTTIPQPKLDPREELMLEIRNFGGRTTLRKVSLNQVNWQLKVHGTNSTVTA